MQKDIVVRLPYKKYKFVLEHDMLVWIEIKGEIHYFIIPKGTETDFASIPPLLQIFLKPTDPRIAFAALIHDFLYFKHGFFSLTTNEFVPISRKEADLVIFNKCQSFEMDIVRAIIVFIVVRVGGLIAWNKHKKLCKIK